MPDKMNFSIFYGSAESEEQNIAYSMLKVLDSLPHQCLEPIAKNVVFAGGFWRIRGMQKFFKKKVVEQLEKFPKLKSQNIKQKLGTL